MQPRSAGVQAICRRALILLTMFVTSVTSVDAAERVDQRVSAVELDKALYAFADRYTTQVVAATDAVSRNNPSADQRRLAHQVKLVSVSSIYDIVTNADPFAKLMDMLMVVTLQSYRWIDEDHAERQFAQHGTPLVQAMRGLRVDIWNVASRVLRPDQLQQLDALILDWRKRNPHVEILAYLRFDEVAGARGISALEEIKASGLFAEIAEATKAVDEVRLLAERAFYQAKRMPFLLTWQIEALVNESLAKPELAQSLRATNTLAQSADRATAVIEKLPAQISQEREALVGVLEDRSGRLASLLGDVRQTTTVADQLAARVHSVSQSGERLTANLRDTATGLTETTRAIDALLAKQPPAQEPSKPFDINPYVKASSELNQTVAGLNDLLGKTDGFLQRRPWTMPARDFDALLTMHVDRLFWRALLLIAAFFAMLYLYRLAASRITPRAKAAS